MNRIFVHFMITFLWVAWLKAQDNYGLPNRPFGLQGITEASNEFFEDSIDTQLLNKAKEIAKRIYIIDCHNHNLFQPSTRAKPKQVNYSMLKKGGVNCILQIFPLDFNLISNPSEDILNDIRNAKERIKNDSMKVSIALRRDNFISLPKDDSVKVIIGLEYFKGLFRGNVKLLNEYYKAGVREIGLVRKGGLDSIYINNELTQFGYDLIQQMNYLGIICDITHLPESAQIRIIEASRAPVILSHTASFSLVNNDFNAKDSTIESLVKKGGIICITFYSGQLSEHALDHLSKKKDINQIPRAQIEDVVDQIDYLVEKVGIDFVGIGSDYGGSGRMAPEGLETIEGFPLIIYYLLRKGYTENEIQKIMGLNFIRFFDRVKKVAASD